MYVPSHLQVSSDGMHAKGDVRVTDDYLLILKLYLKAELKSLVGSLLNPFYILDFKALYKLCDVFCRAGILCCAGTVFV